MAGLETRLSDLRETGKNVIKLSIVNAIIPMLIGISIGIFFGYGHAASLLIGVIFISSSIAVIIPSLESQGLLRLRLGRSIVAATIIEDVLSLVLLSVILQTVQPSANISLPLFYMLLFALLYFFRLFVPKITRLLHIGARTKKDFLLFVCEVQRYQRRVCLFLEFQ